MNGQSRQKGMTLLELLAAMAIAAMLISGVLALVFQEYRGTDITKTTVTAAHEIGNAARWISQDAMMAESTDLVEGADPVNYLTLTWVERHDFADIPHSSNYSLWGTELQRNYDGTETTVARNISKVEFSQTGDLITVSISCTPRWWAPERTVQKTYRVYLRPEEGS
ncbi:MAG: prepilin-type N-terminal cleavage/methylation domain-containing protein [Dehalococcoidales bacterium]